MGRERLGTACRVTYREGEFVMAKRLGVDGDRIEMREGGGGDVEGVDGGLVAGHFSLAPESQQLVLLRRLRGKRESRRH